MWRLNCFILVIILLLAVPAGSAELRVPSQYSTIQAAVIAAGGGDTVIIENGVHQGDGNRNIDFYDKAITVRSENGWENCTIDCQYNGWGFYFHYSEGPTSVLDGLRIIRSGGSNGHGIRCEGTSPTITNCSISDCGCNNAIHCLSASPEISNCIITNIDFDSAIFCQGSSPVISDCNISNNSSWAGGALCCFSDSNVSITNCTIKNNTSQGVGGAIYIEDSNATITNSTINYNSAIGRDGWYEIMEPPECDPGCYPGCDPEIDPGCFPGCIPCEPMEMPMPPDSGYGGGIYCGNSVLKISNCLLSRNVASSGCDYANTNVFADSFGGGIYCTSQSSVTINNTTISDNSAEKNTGCVYEGTCQGGGIYNDNSTVTIENSIIWGNSMPSELSQDEAQIHGDADISYSDVNQGLWPGTGNIEADPLFTTGPRGDYYLSHIAAGQAADSPCINIGSGQASGFGLDTYTTCTDYDSDANLVDLGYHYGIPDAITGDLDGNYSVDMLDFSKFGVYWRKSDCGTCGGADLTDDHQVNLDDLQQFALNWLKRSI